MPVDTEIEAIEKRYKRRHSSGCADRYSPLDPYSMMAEQEKDRAVVRMLRQHELIKTVPQLSLLEIGCGAGNNLLRFIRLGFAPVNLCGNELMPERLQAARQILPPSVQLLPGDASATDLADESFNIVCLFTVMSSILNDAFQERLAGKAWSLTKPGGGVLWYDFIYNNPANPDVRGVPVRRLRELFPDSKPVVERITLAPPIGRRVARWWDGYYSILNRIKPLRSHVLAWLPKNA